jgi:hypothetical protein
MLVRKCSGMPAYRLANRMVSYTLAWSDHFGVYAARNSWPCMVKIIRIALPWHKLKSLAKSSLEGSIDMPKFYECEICGHCHPWEWNGDCRDDANRFTNEQLEAQYGDDLELVPMEDRLAAD